MQRDERPLANARQADCLARRRLVSYALRRRVSRAHDVKPFLGESPVMRQHIGSISAFLRCAVKVVIVLCRAVGGPFFNHLGGQPGNRLVKNLQQRFQPFLGQAYCPVLVDANGHGWPRLDHPTITITVS
jgi:hypothetical protein